MARLFIATGIFYPEPGGPATYLHELLPILHERGWDIQALTFADKLQDTGEPFPVTRVNRKQSIPKRWWEYAQHSRSLLKWADLTYIHTLGLPLMGGHKTPRVAKVVGDVAWERAVRKGWIPPTEDIDVFQTQAGYKLQVKLNQFTQAREAKTMQGIIVPSRYLKRIVVGWGVPEQQVHVIYNALPPDMVAPSLSQEEARQQLGWGDAPTLLTVGRILPWKGVDHLIQAISRLPHIHLKIAGDGADIDALKQMAVDLHVSERVQFLGRISREQMPILMKATDYLALYSGYEGLSHTLLEGLRVGTPLIASDKGGNPEVVQHEKNGLLVPYVNVDALTETIKQAFGAGKRAEYAQNTHVGLERFDFHRMINHTETLLKTFV